MYRFQGKAVVVTGAASGMGYACMERLYQEGASIVAMDLATDRLDTFRAQADDERRVQVVRMDVSDHAQVASVIAGVADRVPHLYGLVNCAGVRGIGMLEDWTAKQWQHVMAVNLDGTFNMCQAFVNALRAKNAEGAIVNISSTAAIRPLPNRLAYVAAKMGVSGITQAMAVELGPVGIRVNAVAPGVIRTPRSPRPWRTRRTWNGSRPPTRWAASGSRGKSRPSSPSCCRPKPAS